MTRRGRIGLISLTVGIVSVPIAAAATYGRSLLGGKGTSFVLDWLMARGMTLSNPNATATVSAPGLISITDERVVILLTVLAVLLAVVAMVVALVAERLREPTLYLSAGYTCGAMAFALFRPLFGVIAMIAGVAVVMVIRHDRKVRDT
jgi:hypothetical protein